MISNSYTEQPGGLLQRYVNGSLTLQQPKIVKLSSLTNVSTTTGHKPTPLVPHAHSYDVLEIGNWNGTKVDQNQTDKGYLTLSASLQEVHTQFAVEFAARMNETRNAALTKLDKQVNLSDLNLTVSLAEYRQLFDLLRGFTPSNIAKRGLDTLSTIFNDPKGSFVNSKGQARAKHTARSLYTSRLKSAQNRANAASLRISVEAAADAWLQYQYGIRPLVNDIYGVADLIYRQELNRYRTIEAVVYIPIPPKLQLKLPYGPTGRLITYDYMVTGRHLVKYVINIDTSKVNKLSAWASMNPASLAWEFLPLSFVADWAVNISQFLTLIEATSNNQAAFLSGTKTELTAYDSINRVSGFLAPPHPYYFSIDAAGSSKYVSYRRSLLSAYPRPVFPTVRMKLGATQMTSAAALFLQQLKSPSKYTPSPLNSKAPTRRPFIRWDKFTHS